MVWSPSLLGSFSLFFPLFHPLDCVLLQIHILPSVSLAQAPHLTGLFLTMMVSPSCMRTHLTQIPILRSSPFFLSLFISFEREREHKWGRGERGRERIPSRLHTVSAEPDVWLNLMNHEIVTWAEIKSWALNLLSHPDAPSLPVFGCLLFPWPSACLSAFWHPGVSHREGRLLFW